MEASSLEATLRQSSEALQYYCISDIYTDLIQVFQLPTCLMPFQAESENNSYSNRKQKCENKKNHT